MLRPRRGGYRNKAEQQFVEWALARGWEVTKRGWPDFFCRLPDGSFKAVEVKRDDWPVLKAEQRVVGRLLRRLGLRTQVWTPSGGLEELPPEGSRWEARGERAGQPDARPGRAGRY